MDKCAFEIIVSYTIPPINTNSSDTLNRVAFQSSKFELEREDITKIQSRDLRVETEKHGLSKNVLKKVMHDSLIDAKWKLIVV